MNKDRTPLGRSKHRPSTRPRPKTLAAREISILADGQAIHGREAAADLRGAAADLREAAADLRDEAADLRDEAASFREQATELREGNAAQREKALDQQATAPGEILRDANERLVVAVVHAQTMTEAAEQVAARMSYLAEHDVLTGLPNRSLLSDRLTQSITLAQRHGNKVAVMYVDLDHFKDINDSLGHAVGDQLLQSAASRLQACVRHSDTVSRQGGDEFVVLLSEVQSVADAILTAEKLIATMAEPHLIDGQRLSVTLSIGISLYPDDGQTAETVLANADAAMYHAKEDGRNRYQVFGAIADFHARGRQSLEPALRQALLHDDFVLHYQPKVDLATDAVIGAEALLRWRRLDDWLVSPAEFVKTAEHCGLILPIGRWVLREACRQMQAWLRDGLDIKQLSVNVSAAELHDKDYLAGVQAILDETGADPRRLQFELTESGLVQDAESSITTLRELKALGIRIAVDDFGTGYSSLSQLRRFPIDTLKIDGSLVREIGAHGDQGVTVSAIIAIGASLGQCVVADGIETLQQLAFLQAHHCAEGQGFFFSPAVAARDFVGFLPAHGAQTGAQA